MIPKPYIVNAPLTDQQAILIEKSLQAIFSGAIQYKTGTYTGTGKAGTILTVGFKAIFIYIQKTIAGAGNSVFGLRDQPDVCFIPGSGFVAGAITAWGTNTITFGANGDANAIGKSYRYFAIG